MLDLPQVTGFPTTLGSLWWPLIMLLNILVADRMFMIVCLQAARPLNQLFEENPSYIDLLLTKQTTKLSNCRWVRDRTI